MFLLDVLFGKSESKGTQGHTARPGSYAPGTAIGHDPKLVAALKEDNRVLLGIFGAIDAAQKAGDLLTAQARLEQFRMALQDHLLKENVRLYVYLEHLLANDPTSHELMHGFRHDMDAIGKVVVGFLGKYQQIGAHPELASEFSKDMAAIGQALSGRIKREEDTLYPMYR